MKLNQTRILLTFLLFLISFILIPIFSEYLRLLLNFPAFYMAKIVISLLTPFLGGFVKSYPLMMEAVFSLIFWWYLSNVILKINEGQLDNKKIIHSIKELLYKDKLLKIIVASLIILIICSMKLFSIPLSQIIGSITAIFFEAFFDFLVLDLRIPLPQLLDLPITYFWTYFLLSIFLRNRTKQPRKA